MELHGCYKLEFMCIDIAVGTNWFSVCPPHDSLYLTLTRACVCMYMYVCVCMHAHMFVRETKSSCALNSQKSFENHLYKKSYNICPEENWRKEAKSLEEEFCKGPSLLNISLNCSSVGILVENKMWLNYLERLYF